MSFLNYIKKTYTPQFYLVIVPFFIITILLLSLVAFSWFDVFLFFVLFGIIGNGITGHRLVAQKQFKPALWLRPFLYLTCTLAGYGPVWYWRVQHIHHHRHTETDNDVHSPHTQTLWKSFFGWTFHMTDFNDIMLSERRLLRKTMADRKLYKFTKYYYHILWAFVMIIGVVNPSLLLAYLIFYWIEACRLGLTFTVSHMNLPFNYRNFETKDSSQNNIALGYLTFGFGWHNNHHANPGRLDDQVKWWEFDVESKIAKLINLIPGKK
jgi:stearoyl-CoA desaturase (delta-9 desaturase)